MLRAPALWARAVAGQRRGPWASGLQALLAGKPTLAVRTGSVLRGLRGLGSASGDAPGPGGSAVPAPGGGRGSGGGDPGSAGSQDNFPWLLRPGTSECTERRNCPGRWCSKHPPTAGLVRGQRSPGRHGASARADGRWPGGDYLEATRAGKGPGQTGHARGGQGTPQQRGSPATRHPEPLEWERPSIPPVWICGG